MAFAYKVEELLALRDSVSESAVSIDKFTNEDVIKEHVLRPSASASAYLASRSSNRSLRPPVAAALDPAAPYKRPSPTPSIKRGKAEKLLKEHGSPPGIRVTAGGRIVPSDLQPLGTSRYGDAAYRPLPLRAAPGNIMSAPPPLHGNGTARIEVVAGQPVVIVGDRIFALPTVGATETASTSGPPTIEASGKNVPDVSALPHSGFAGLPFGPVSSTTPAPFTGLDVVTLKTQQAHKKQELRTVEQTEVLQASHQSEAWRANMIEKKRCLIVELDALRKQITILEAENGTSAQPSSFPGPVGSSSATMPTLPTQFPQPLPQAMYPFPGANPYASMMYQPQSFGAFPNFPATEPTPFVPASTNPPHSPGSASRRSRAIEIKPPPMENKKQLASALNPKSPTYEPAINAKAPQAAVRPTPSPQKRSPWDLKGVADLVKHGHRGSSQKHSLSSIDTTDFFPTNTHEHSSTRVAPQVTETKHSSNENTAVPSTPEKHWPASPWNEGHSGRSRNNEPAPKLTSWPEAFGKQPSYPSLRQGATVQPSSSVLERASAVGANTLTTAASSRIQPRTNSDRRIGAEENWPFSSSTTTHVPSTYQEGYQAGYDHVGIPDSPEVLQGYVQGLLHFLTDESKRRQADYQRGTDSQTPSLKGLVAGSLPHDSAVSMDFDRASAPNGGQENIRSTKVDLTEDMLRDSAYHAQGGTEDGSVQFALHNESTQESRQRIASTAQYLNQSTTFPQRNVSNHRHAVFPSIKNDVSKGFQDKGNGSYMDSSMNGGMSRQTFGSQLQNRNYGTPLNLQRFYPTPKEMSQGDIGSYNGAAPRLLANHRLSGLDGAMDDLSEMMDDTHVDESRTSAGNQSNEAPLPTEHEETDASCFKSSSNKGKQKATSSPSKSGGLGQTNSTSSPVNAPSSPKKSGEHSPAKAKLEQVTNKFRRAKKDDPRTMSPDERMKRSEKWRQRFQQLKKTEIDEIDAHRRNSRT